MKHFISILLFFLISCINSTEPNTTSTIPSACSCAKNAMKAGTNEFDQSIQTACEKYMNIINQEERVERAMEGLECINKEIKSSNLKEL